MAEFTPINFADLNQALLDRAEAVVSHWLPGGKRHGKEYVCGDLAGGAGRSMSVNLITGRWADFSADRRGGDLVSLYAEIHGLSQIEAARKLMDDMGWQAYKVQTPAKTGKKVSVWEPVTPVPANAPPPVFEFGYRDETQNNQWVKLPAVAHWAYRLDGQLFGYVARFHRPSSKGGIQKETVPFTWCVDTSDDRGVMAWRQRQWSVPRPLYLPRGETPIGGLVIGVEGEKCAEALQDMIGALGTVVTWPGGCSVWDKANWATVQAADHLVLWPDCDSKRHKLTVEEKAAGVDPDSKPFLAAEDQPGAAAMHGIARYMSREFSRHVSICQIPAPGVAADGWDCADAIAEGWDLVRVMDFINAAVPLTAIEDEEANRTAAGELSWVDEVERAMGEAAPSSSSPSPEAEPAAPNPGEGAEPALAASAAAKRQSEKLKELLRKVQSMTERFALIYGSDTAWDRQEQMIVRIPTMRLAFGKDVVNMWLARPSRRMVLPTDLVFEPGHEVADHQINMFVGLPVEPQACDDQAVAPMLQLLRHLCAESADTTDGVDEVMHWVLRWMALPLQQVGTKMQTACVFHGAQGTGKNLFWDMWRDLFGAYGITVGQTEIEDKFNGWISRKLAIIGDEVVSRSEMYHSKNRLKLVVTQETKFAIRGMMQETRWESNHANVVFLSNESQPLALEERDRRYLVVYTPLEADVELYQAVREFKLAGGLGKWLHYLQSYPLDGFGAHTKPLMTKAKADLIELGWKAPERFAHEWLTGVIDLPIRVCAAEQLYRAFRRWCDLAGERWPPEQAKFTSQVKRWARERVGRDEAGRRELPALEYREGIALRLETGNRKTVRCWVPQGTRPLAGISEGEWAAESVKAFEDDLRKFTRRYDQPQATGGEH